MENPCKIVFFGDSITIKYVPAFGEILKNEYSDNKIEIVNAGVIGETSRDGLKRISSIQSKTPQVVVIGFGMNDWRKGVSKQEFKKNLIYMIEKFEVIGSRVILLTINPDYQGFFKGTSKAIGDYNCIIRETAKEKCIKIADVDLLWKRKIKPVQKGLKDKIHPNKLGYKIYYESLLHVVPQSHTVILWQYNGRESLCNYKCPYCYYFYSPKAENYFFGNIQEWHDSFKKSFGNQKLIFYLAFGEPTLGEAFYNVLKMIEKEPKWSLRITTNLSQNLERLVNTRLAKEGRLNINASFHPTQVGIEIFLEQALYLRKHHIEVPIVYVMWSPHLRRFESDFKVFNDHNFLVHIRRFKGIYKGKYYPKSYTDEERQFIARYCDDATIKYMLNEDQNIIFDRKTYSGFHFFIVDCTGNIGYDSNCFSIYTKYRTIFGNVLQPHTLKFPPEPTQYPKGYTQRTVDGVSNYLELGYHQLEGNNVLAFAKQGGVYHTENGVFYSNINKDFKNSQIRSKYYFPPRGIKDEYFIFKYLGTRKFMKFLIKQVRQYLIEIKMNNKFINIMLRS